jgi:hypothetical protein
MKVCPRCQKTYTDENLNFCLEDGSVLTQAAAAPPATEQVLINQTRMPSPPNQPGAQGSWGSAPQQFSMQPPAKKGSKTWVWVVGILGLLILVCGGGLVGFFAWVASQDTGHGNSSTTNPSPRPSATSPTATPVSTSSDRTNVEVVDMSLWADSTDDALAEFNGTEMIMASKEKGYYYVMVAKGTPYDKADVAVTVRNTEDQDSRLGYGLIFHSSIIPLMNDYAFLIDAKKKRYRVVNHTPSKENVIVAWINSPKIKSGSEANVLEAKDDGENIALYINGDLDTTIKNKAGISTGGVPGIYSGDAAKAAFSKLEVRK